MFGNVDNHPDYNALYLYISYKMQLHGKARDINNTI